MFIFSHDFLRYYNIELLKIKHILDGIDKENKLNRIYYLEIINYLYT